jgi:hypothetical protein
VGGVDALDGILEGARLGCGLMQTVSPLEPRVARAMWIPQRVPTGQQLQQHDGEREHVGALDVLGLQVAMHDPGVVRGLHRREDLVEADRRRV